MKPRSLLLGAALAVPAVLLPLSSCSDANDNSAGPDIPQIGTPPQPGGSGHPFIKVNFARVPEAEVALAVKEDGEAEAAELQLASTTTPPSDIAPHDPTRVGQRVTCLDGDEATGSSSFNGEGTRFRNRKGCELDAQDDDLVPDNNVAALIPSHNRIAGRLLTRIRRLDFYFAGGNVIGGSPRINVPVDECRDPEGNFLPNPQDAVTTNTAGGVTNCPPGFSTDGNFDGIARADVDACFDEEDANGDGDSDGDGNVGVLRGEDDPTCQFEYVRDPFGTPMTVGLFPNFVAVETALPGARVARDFPTFILLDQQNHYLIYRVNIS